MHDKGTDSASISIDANALICGNLWTVSGVGPLRTSLDELALPQGDVVSINGSATTAMDTAGAWLLLLLQRRERLETAGRQVVLDAFRPEHDRLVQYIADAAQGAETVAPRRAAGSLQDRWFSLCSDLVGFLAFIGEVIVALLLAIRHPGRVRWQEILDDMYQSGVRALPLVGLLSFLMGVVIAYQGAVQLKLYGTNIYIADLVGHSMLRELALRYYTRSRWADTPARMLAPVTADAMQVTGKFQALYAGPGSIAADYRLDTELIRFHQDFTRQPSVMHITMSAQLVDLRESRVLGAQQFNIVESATTEDSYGGVVAANKAVSRLLDELALFCVSGAGTAHSRK